MKQYRLYLNKFDTEKKKFFTIDNCEIAPPRISFDYDSLSTFSVDTLEKIITGIDVYAFIYEEKNLIFVGIVKNVEQELEKSQRVYIAPILSYLKQEVSIKPVFPDPNSTIVDWFTTLKDFMNQSEKIGLNLNFGEDEAYNCFSNSIMKESGWQKINIFDKLKYDGSGYPNFEFDINKLGQKYLDSNMWFDIDLIDTNFKRIAVSVPLDGTNVIEYSIETNKEKPPYFYQNENSSVILNPDKSYSSGSLNWDSYKDISDSDAQSALDFTWQDNSDDKIIGVTATFVRDDFIDVIKVGQNIIFTKDDQNIFIGIVNGWELTPTTRTLKCGIYARNLTDIV